MTPTPHESWEEEFELFRSQIGFGEENLTTFLRIRDFIRGEKEKSILSERSRIIGVVEGLMRREYLRGMIQGDRLPKDYTVEMLDALYERYLMENPSMLKDAHSHLREPLQE